MALSRSARYRRGRRRPKEEEKTQPSTLKIRNRRGRVVGTRPNEAAQMAADRASAKRFRKTGPVNEALKPPSEAQQMALDKASAAKKRDVSETGKRYSRPPKPPTLPAPSKPAAKKPASKPTSKQAQKADFNKTYQEARAKALKIKDAKKRKIALEGVTQMGREFHKKYYNKK